MISRYIFVCFYLICFSLINRWHDSYEYCFHSSTKTISSNQITSVNQLNIKQLQHILNLRGISNADVNEKYDLIKMVEQTGFVRTNELSESIEDSTKRETTVFSSYTQLLDLVDDCKDTIWLFHILPNEKRRQSLIYLSPDKWLTMERRLSLFNIKTGILKCTNREHSNLCRTLNIERFILMVPSINRRSINIYSRSISSMKDLNYQYILKWLIKTLEHHMNKDLDWYELASEKRSVLEFQIDANSFVSIIPVYYFTLLYRYGSIVNFRLNMQENKTFQIRYSFKNSTIDTYIYNNMNNSVYFHELYTYRSLNIFLSHLTINSQTLIYLYFFILNIYFSYDIYLVKSFFLLFKKMLTINILSGFIWLFCLKCLSTETIDHILQRMSFYLIERSQYSTILMFVRSNFVIDSIISKWILYPTMIILHIIIGLYFRYYLNEKFGRRTYDLSSNLIMIDQAHVVCSNLWQFILCILFSDQVSDRHTNNTLLQYFSHDSFWLSYNSLSAINSNVNISNNRAIDLKHLPTWRFTTRKRKPTHGVNEYYSDIDLEISNHGNEKDYTRKKPFEHRHRANMVSVSQQDSFYASESDETNNSVNLHKSEMNSSNIYKCSICLEKYFNHVYICTLPCLHHFHRKCLIDWLANSEHSTCPLCRSSVLI